MGFVRRTSRLSIGTAVIFLFNSDIDEGHVSNILKFADDTKIFNRFPVK